MNIFRCSALTAFFAICGCRTSEVVTVPAMLKAEPEIIELGLVKPGVAVNAQVKLVYTGASTIRIESLSKACVCTNTKLDVDSVSASGSCVLGVEIRPSTSMRSTVVNVHYAGQDGQTKDLQVPIVWECDVVSPFRSTRLDFGKMPVGSNGEFSEPIEKAKSATGIGANRIKFNVEHAELIEAKEDEARERVLFRLATDKAGHFQATVQARIEDSPNRPELADSVVLADTIVTWTVEDEENVRLIKGVFEQRDRGFIGKVLALASNDLILSDLIVSVQPDSLVNFTISERNPHSFWIEIEGTVPATEFVVIDIKAKGSEQTLAHSSMTVSELLRASE